MGINSMANENDGGENSKYRSGEGGNGEKIKKGNNSVSRASRYRNPTESGGGGGERPVRSPLAA